MKFKLQIDTKFTINGLRIFVKMLSDNNRYQKIFLCRLNSKRTNLNSQKIQIYLFGRQTLFMGPGIISTIHGSEVYEETPTPERSIGLGTPYKQTEPRALVIKGTETFDQSHLGATVAFTGYISDYPLWNQIKAAADYGSTRSYEDILSDPSYYIITDILTSKVALLNNPLPTSTDSPINCTIGGSTSITMDCYIQSIYKGTNQIVSPDPYELILTDSFIETASDSTHALAFIKALKADVKKFVDRIGSVGNIDGFEVENYDV